MQRLRLAKLLIFSFSRCLSLLFVIVILTGTFALSSTDNSVEQDFRYRQLAEELRCPTCQGLSVKDSEAGFSNSIKAKIRELIKMGKSNQEIKAYFVERYGEWILRAPPKKGFNLVLWILPGAGIVIGLLLVLFRTKRWVSKPLQEELAELTPEEEQKIKEDLGRFENG